MGTYELSKALRSYSPEVQAARVVEGCVVKVRKQARTATNAIDTLIVVRRPPKKKRAVLSVRVVDVDDDGPSFTALDVLD